MKLHELAVDVLHCISDFSGTAACSHVCSRLWNALHGRHLTYSIRRECDPLQTLNNLSLPGLHTFALRCVGPVGPLSDNLGDSRAQALARLKDAPALHTLTLSLWFNCVGDSGAHALAGLKEAPAVHTLTLVLGANNIGASGVQALAGLKEARALHTLYLDLGHNAVGDTQVAAIIRGMTAEGWTAPKYHPLSKNCNCFCKELSKLLGVRTVPYSVNRGPQFLKWVSPECAVRAGVRMHYGEPVSQTQPQRQPRPQPQQTFAPVGVHPLLPVLYY